MRYIYTKEKKVNDTFCYIKAELIVEENNLYVPHGNLKRLISVNFKFQKQSVHCTYYVQAKGPLKANLYMNYSELN